MRRLLRSTFGLIAVVSFVFAIAILGIGLTLYEVSHESLEE
ncbi:hypothetical protein [Xanthomonas axonopodis]